MRIILLMLDDDQNPAWNNEYISGFQSRKVTFVKKERVEEGEIVDYISNACSSRVLYFCFQRRREQVKKDGDAGYFSELFGFLLDA